LRSQAEMLATAHASRDAAARKAAQATAALDLAEADERQASARADSASIEAAAASNVVRQLTPVWGEAQLLDKQIASAKEELAVAEHEALQAAAVASECEAAACNTRAAYEALRREQHDITGQLAARAGHAALAAARDQIAQLLAARADLGAQFRDAEARHRTIEADLAHAQVSISAAEQTLLGEKQKREEWQKQLITRRHALREIDFNSLMLKDTALRTLEAGLARAADHARERDGGLEAAARAREAAEAAEHLSAEAATKLAAAEREYVAQTAARAELGRVLDLAEATLSTAAEHLRAQLIPEEPCPVCGAREHPHVEDGGAAKRLGLAVRKRREELDCALKELTANITQARGNRAAGESRREVARDAAEKEQAKAEDALRALSALLTRLKSGLSEVGLPAATLGDAATATPAALEGMAHFVTRELEAVNGSRTRGEALGRECDELQRRLDELAASIETRDLALSEERSQSARLTNEATRLRELSRGLAERLEAAQQELRPHFQAAGLTQADLARDAASAGRHVLLLADAYARLGQAQARLAAEVQRTGQELDPVERDLAAAQSERARRENALTEKRARLAALLQSRMELLSGEPTDANRDRHLAGEASAREALDAARRLLAGAQHTVAGLRAASTLAAEQLTEAENRLAHARESFAAGVATLGISEEEALRHLAVSPGEIRALTEKIEVLRRSAGDAETTVRTRELDLAQRRGDGEEPTLARIASLEAEAGERTRTLQAVRDQLTRNSTLLEKDDEAREKEVSIDREIDAVRGELAVWRDVDAAIGQKDGTKFSRFAQGVTLGHLVQLANVQLRGLGPRYALKRSSTSDLALEVVDRDMGGELRAPRSLSGGERFLVSLALALALSGLEGRQSFVDTLFIDEGFGSLDRETLDMAVEALESLQGQGRKVGVVTHVAAMIDRIAVQVRVHKRGGGRSVVRTRDANLDLPGLQAAQ
jgi:DNA repair protein SbcC/Rad50